MSVQILSACWRIQKISPTQKLVLISLADQANDHGVCWPSVAHMQERTCLSERAIRSAISQLSDAGLLSKTERNGRSTYYTLTPAAFAPLQEMHHTPAPAAPQPLQEMHHTPAPAAPITVIEPSIEPSNKQKNSYSAADLVSIGIDESIARDFMEVRKRKKAPLTETAMRGIAREAAAAGYTMNQALQVCAERNWQSFKADWVRDKSGTGFVSYYELATGQRPEF